MIRYRSASKNGPCCRGGRTRAFLIIRRNLVPFRERADGTSRGMRRPAPEDFLCYGSSCWPCCRKLVEY
jgi:hypothetical protein